MTQAQSALIELICSRQKQLLNWLRGKIGDEADDVLARAHLAAVEAVMHGRQIDNPESYAVGIVRNILFFTFSEFRAERSRYGGDPSTFALASDQFDPEKMMLRNELAAIIDQAPSRNDQEILERLYVQDQDAEEVCEAMKISPLQFRLLKSRAKSRLASTIQRKERLSKLASSCRRAA